MVLEATWLGNFEPYSKMSVSSYFTEMMEHNKQQDLIEKYNLAPFKVQVLSQKRTFCEKIMSLVRFSRTDEPISDLRNKIRHIYDLHQMLEDDQIQKFIKGSEFDIMLLNVGKDDIIGYKNNNEWLYEHPAKAMIFDTPIETWKELKHVYNTTFKGIVIGELPPEEEILKALEFLSSRIKTVNWELS